MANKIATLMGVLFILIGLGGFASDNLLGAHLTWAHNLIHLVSGIASVYIGVKGEPFTAKGFCLAFGVLYLSLAVVGYWFGYDHGVSDLPMSAQDGGMNGNMFRMIPGVLELGTMDHLIHVVIGAVYLIAGALTRTHRTAVEVFEGNPE